MAYTTIIPTLDNNHVKPYSIFNEKYMGYFCMDPSSNLDGEWDYCEWHAYQREIYECKFNIDLSSEYAITRVYYQNSHLRGTGINNGAREVLIYGTNERSAFLNLDYSDTENINLLCDTEFSMHNTNNASDPKYTEDFSNVIPYRYYILRIARNWYGNSFIGLRRLGLQIST